MQKTTEILATLRCHYFSSFEEFPLLLIQGSSVMAEKGGGQQGLVGNVESNSCVLRFSAGSGCQMCCQLYREAEQPPCDFAEED